MCAEEETEYWRIDFASDALQEAWTHYWEMRRKGLRRQSNERLSLFIECLERETPDVRFDSIRRICVNAFSTPYVYGDLQYPLRQAILKEVAAQDWINSAQMIEWMLRLRLDKCMVLFEPQCVKTFGFEWDCYSLAYHANRLEPEYRPIAKLLLDWLIGDIVIEMERRTFGKFAVSLIGQMLDEVQEILDRYPGEFEYIQTNVNEMRRDLIARTEYED